MKSILVSIAAAVELVGCGKSQQSPADYADLPTANYDPNKSWGLSEEEEAAQEAQPEPPTTKTPDISIHETVIGGNIEAVKKHLAAGTDVDVKGGFADGTPLHYAAANGHKVIVELLIAKGVNINAVDNGGDTPLDKASAYKHVKTADLLRKHGGKTKRELKAKGKTIQATLTGVSGDKVMFQLANGQSVPYPIANLGPESQEKAKAFADAMKD